MRLTKPANRVEFLNKSHTDCYLEHLLRLEPQARGQRFHGELSDVFVAMHAGAALSDPNRVVVGYFADDMLRGAGELMTLADASHSAEFALSIEQPFRHRGIGKELMSAMILEARYLKIKRIEVHCLRDNLAMQRLATRFAADLKRENGTVLGVIERHKDLQAA